MSPRASERVGSGPIVAYVLRYSMCVSTPYVPTPRNNVTHLCALTLCPALLHLLYLNPESRDSRRDSSTFLVHRKRQRASRQISTILKSCATGSKPVADEVGLGTLEHRRGLARPEAGCREQGQLKVRKVSETGC